MNTVTDIAAAIHSRLAGDALGTFKRTMSDTTTGPDMHQAECGYWRELQALENQLVLTPSDTLTDLAAKWRTLHMLHERDSNYRPPADQIAALNADAIRTDAPSLVLPDPCPPLSRAVLVGIAEIAAALA